MTLCGEDDLSRIDDRGAARFEAALGSPSARQCSVRVRLVPLHLVPRRATFAVVSKPMPDPALCVPCEYEARGW